MSDPVKRAMIKLSLRQSQLKAAERRSLEAQKLCDQIESSLPRHIRLSRLEKAQKVELAELKAKHASQKNAL